MKKLVLAVTLVVLLAAAVVGGQALASSKPANVIVSEETASILGSSYWGYPLRIKSLSGTAEISADDQILLDETYPGTRHVSLTVFNWGVDSGIPPFADGVEVSMNIPFLGYSAVMESHQTDFYKTFEFDTDNWKLRARDYGNQTLKVYYWATITYPSNQW
jgi:hypothetical protein